MAGEPREVPPGGLWLVERPLRWRGVVELGRRTAIARIPDGLFVCSPCRSDAALERALARLGPVRAIVAPNRNHRAHLAEWTARHPGAELWLAPGLAERSPELAANGTLGDAPEPLWAGELDQTLVRGVRVATEAVFLHRATRTLILTDLCFDLPRSLPLATRLYARAQGVLDTFAMPRAYRLAVRDRRALRASIDRILGWDFDRVVVGHGRVHDTGGRALVEAAFRWLRDR